MKHIFKTMAFLLAIVLFAGCHDITTEGVTSITYYPTFTLTDGPMLTLPLGQTFTDPGVNVMEGQNDITDKVKISGTVNTNEVGVYFLTYSAVNVDGFTGSTTRTVVVYNPNITTDISGSYTVAAGTQRLTLASGATTPYNGYPVSLTMMAPGVFSVSDFYGGYYDKRAGYGSSYAMTGYISLNEDNSIDLIYSHVNGWGDGLDELDDASYDPNSGTIQWGAVYVGSYSFDVILSK